MGEFASGRRARPRKKTTVEECHQLDVRTLARDGALAVGHNGTVRWKVGERDAGSVSYVVAPAGDGALLLTLHYRTSRNGIPGEPIELPIRLESTLPHLGGVRWWGRCPLAVRGAPCNRRVAKLFLYGRYFGCRRCHDLTYRSCHDGHLLDFYYDSLAEGLGISRRLAKRYERDLATWTNPRCRKMPKSIAAAMEARPQRRKRPRAPS